MAQALAVVTRPQEAHGLTLGEALNRLDAGVADPALRSHPHLRHYLQNRSYQKAARYLVDEKLVSA